MAYSITVDDREVQQALKRIGDGLPDGVMGRVYSRGADQGRGRYEFYVMGHGRQAEIHQGRWQTDRSISEDEADNVANIYRRGLRELVDGRRRTLREVTDEALELVYQAAIYYPPPPAGSRYVRTFTLRRSWEKENKT